MNYADLVLYSNAIFDSVHDAPFSGAVAIAGNKILYVGPQEEVQAYISADTTIKHFENNMIMPGFFDGHGHYQTAAVREYASCISYLEDCESEAEVVEGVRAYLKKHPDCKRVHGRCWFFTSWGPDAALPTKKSLDEAFPDIPVYLLSSSGHMSWLNTAAIRECNLEQIIKDHPEWPPEFAIRDENGDYTGVLTENLSYFVRYMVEVYPFEEILDCELRFQDLLTSYGITGFTDTRVLYPKLMWDELEPLKQLENEGKLHLRFNQWAGHLVDGTAHEEGYMEQGLKDLKRIDTFMHSDKLRIAGVKLMLDGVPDSNTGAMLQPYADNPATRGELLAPAEDYVRAIVLANKAGYSVKCHCLGDRSVRTAIDGYEASRKENGDLKLRNSVEHMNIIADSDIERMKELDIIASVQPAHMVDWFNGCGEKIFGHELNLMESRYRTIIDKGIKYAVGTDVPVVTVDPLHTVYEAIARKKPGREMKPPFTPEQAMTLPEVLKGYTAGSAYANGMETRVGTLEAGKLADIAVIDRNLFAISVEEIPNCKNICTIFDGEIIYEA